MKNKVKLWVVTGHSESGDDYGPYVFSKKPDQKTMKAIAAQCDVGIDVDGPGDFGGYVYFETTSAVLDSL